MDPKSFLKTQIILSFSTIFLIPAIFDSHTLKMHNITLNRPLTNFLNFNFTEGCGIIAVFITRRNVNLLAWFTLKKMFPTTVGLCFRVSMFLHWDVFTCHLANEMRRMHVSCSASTVYIYVVSCWVSANITPPNIANKYRCRQCT